MPALRSILEAVARDPGKVGGAAVKRLQQLAAPWHGAHDLRLRLTSRQALFTEIYRSQAWGSRESSSGTGSELRATDNIRANLPDMLSRIGATSLLDAPCGDWNWMRHIDLPVRRYYGVDIVAPLIESDRTRFGNEHRQFTVADLTLDPLPRADAILCRDCAVHVSFHDFAAILENFRRTGATSLLLNTYPEVRHNRDQFTGRHWRRLNFRLPPFGFPEPAEMIADGADVDPSQLAVWRLQELPSMRITADTSHRRS